MSRNPLPKKDPEASVAPGTPAAKETLAERLRACKRELKKISEQLRPQGPIENIEEKQIDNFVNKLNSIYDELSNAPKNTRFLKSREGASKKVFDAKRELLSAKRFLRDYNEKLEGKLYGNYLDSLVRAHDRLDEAIQLFSVSDKI